MEDDIKKVKDAGKMGAPYVQFVCAACREKLIEEGKKLRKRDLLFPARIAKRFMNLVCPDCLARIRIEMEKKQRAQQMQRQRMR